MADDIDKDPDDHMKTVLPDNFEQLSIKERILVFFDSVPNKKEPDNEHLAVLKLKLVQKKQRWWRNGLMWIGPRNGVVEIKPKAKDDQG